MASTVLEAGCQRLQGNHAIITVLLGKCDMLRPRASLNVIKSHQEMDISEKGGRCWVPTRNQSRGVQRKKDSVCAIG